MFWGKCVLTLGAPHRYAPVGVNMKNPKNPVWVIYAENHYSVLFAPSQDSLASRGRKAFDAYYCK